MKQRAKGSVRASFSGLLSQLENLSEGTTKGKGSHGGEKQGKEGQEGQPQRVIRAMSKVLLDTQKSPRLESPRTSTPFPNENLADNGNAKNRLTAEDPSRIKKIEKWEELESLLPKNLSKKRSVTLGDKMATAPAQKSEPPQPIQRLSVMSNRDKDIINDAPPQTKVSPMEKLKPVNLKNNAEERNIDEEDNFKRSKALESISSLVSLSSNRVTNPIVQKGVLSNNKTSEADDSSKVDTTSRAGVKSETSTHSTRSAGSQIKTGGGNSTNKTLESTKAASSDDVQKFSIIDNLDNPKRPVMGSLRGSDADLPTYPLASGDKKYSPRYDIKEISKDQETPQITASSATEDSHEKEGIFKSSPPLKTSPGAAVDNDAHFHSARGKSASLTSIQSYDHSTKDIALARYLADLLLSISRPLLNVPSRPPDFSSKIKESFLPNKNFPTNNFSLFTIQDASEETLKTLVLTAVKDSEIFIILDDKTYQQRKIEIIEACGDITENHSSLKKLSDECLSFLNAFLSEIDSFSSKKSQTPELPSSYLAKKIQSITSDYRATVEKLWKSVGRLIGAENDVYCHICAVIRYAYLKQPNSLVTSGSAQNQKSPFPPFQVEKEIIRLRRILKKDQASLSETGNSDKFLSSLRGYISIVDKINLSASLDDSLSLSKTVSSATDDSLDTEEYPIINDANDSPNVQRPSTIDIKGAANSGPDTPNNDRPPLPMEPMTANNSGTPRTSVSSQTVSSVKANDPTETSALRDLYLHICSDEDAENVKPFSIETLAARVRALKNDFLESEEKLSFVSKGLLDLRSHLAPIITATFPGSDVTNPANPLDVLEIISKVTRSVTAELKETRSCLLEKEYENKSVKEAMENMEDINRKNLDSIKTESKSTLQERDNTIKDLEKKLAEVEEERARAIADLESQKILFTKDISDKTSELRRELASENMKSIYDLETQKNEVIENNKNQISDLHEQLAELRRLVQEKEDAAREAYGKLEDLRANVDEVLKENKSNFENEIRALVEKISIYEKEYVNKNDVQSDIRTEGERVRELEAEVRDLKEQAPVKYDEPIRELEVVRQELINATREMGVIKSRNTELEEELEKLKSNLGASEKSLSDAKSEADKARSELTRMTSILEDKMRKIEKELSSVNSDKKKALSTANDLSSKLQKLETKLSDVEDKFMKEKNKVSSLSKENKQFKTDATNLQKDMEQLTGVLMDQKEKNVIILEELDDLKLKESFLQDKIKMFEECNSPSIRPDISTVAPTTQKPT